MGSLFRSEEIQLCQLFLQSEAAFDCVAELGELGIVQFRDLNPDINVFKRKYVSEVRRCNEMERQLRYLEMMISKDAIPLYESGENPKVPHAKEMSGLESNLDKFEMEVRQISKNGDNLRQSYLKLIELKEILRNSKVCFDDKNSTRAERKTQTKPQTKYEKEMDLKLKFMSGVILREKMPVFEKMLWRVGRGNILLQHIDIGDSLEDPRSHEQVYKSIFYVFFQGDELRSRVKRICEGFHATIYHCPESSFERRKMFINVSTRIEDLTIVLEKTNDHRRRLLVAAALNVNDWFTKVRKMKSVYHTLNSFNQDVTQKCLIAECWVPILNMDQLQKALETANERSRSCVPPIVNKIVSAEEPPTYNRTNKFTNAFQALIDAYGVASYREMNPAPYTIITFPFLFAVMFGDLGHGAIMTLLALWMVWKEKALSLNKSTNEIWNIFFGGRYIILLMGLFSMYTGLIYNDVFSKSLNLFGSGWKINYNISTITNSELSLQLDPATDDFVGAYPFGLDPVWQIAPANKIIFHNAFKMKISIIFGVMHMIFGISVGVYNHRYFKNISALFTEFIPQMIFLIFLFWYLTFLMFVKWVAYSAKTTGKYNSHCAPSILITFINMILFKMPEEGLNKEGCSAYMFPGQKQLQPILVLLALLCIPTMLVAKPLLIKRARKKLALLKATNNKVLAPLQSETRIGKKNNHNNEAISEIFIYQGIHTIEYVLGSVSHTASYLRLWALSLAHAQLAEVLWSMVFKIGLQASGWFGPIMLFVVFAFWAVLTVGILVLMEGLSAFLHTLRLHWVEFQSKFYTGLGYAFHPFSFKLMLDAVPPLRND